ncbi:hypothetical protein [Mucilaginibacter lacusdianchii]|nr:hypothetical protein [Mucilaginibacter sp. JXJ CY 39]
MEFSNVLTSYFSSLETDPLQPLNERVIYANLNTFISITDWLR